MNQPGVAYPLSQIYFYLNKGCNLRCRHCWIDPEYQTPDQSHTTLDIRLFEEIIEQARPLGLSGVKLTGGEPLLHPQIHEILERVSVQGLSLTLETNGTLLTSQLVNLVAKCPNPFVAVSLDGSDAETHEWVRGVKDCFAESLQGIRRLVQAGIGPQVIMSIMKHNYRQMESVVRLAESLGVESVKFNIVQPSARGEQLREVGETLSIEELVDLGHWVENTLSKKTSLRLFYHHPHAFRPLGNMLGENGRDCGTCGILHILAVLSDGSYALCGIGETVPDLVYGQAQRVPLAELWNQHSILWELRQGLPERLGGICAECIMKELCLGSCIAQNYYRRKNLWAPFWYCEEAQKAGLFPRSRIKPSIKMTRPRTKGAEKGGQIGEERSTGCDGRAV